MQCHLFDQYIADTTISFCVAAYVPEDELKAATFDEEHLHDDGLSLDGQDGEYLCNEEEDDAFRGPPSFRDSPLSNGTNPDAGYGSPLSDTSDRLTDFKSTSSRDGQDKEEGSCHMDTATPTIAAPPSINSSNSNALHDSLAQMKAVYANLISDASWSRIAMDIMKAKPVPSSSAAAISPAALATKAVTTCPSSSSATSNNSSYHNGKSTTVHPPIISAKSNSDGTPATTPLPSSDGNNSGAGGTSNGGSIAYDWHQAALAKTLQQTPYHLLPEPSLFSTVQLYRQNNKLYGSVFTGASKFRCKDCSAAYDTLVGLTVHMNETGHYRDDNKDTEEDNGKRWSKPRKRSLMEMEGKEDAQKVLKCMYCGHSFESLQDLSVHMIKTKHYQKVPLKEPVPALATKLVPSAKKRMLQDPLIAPCSPETVPGSGGISTGDSTGKDAKLAANPYVTPNNRYGYQNGASYTWQFEARKAQILKCMECGSSHDTLQQLTAHMMVTGHFLKVTNSASKKGKQLVFDPVVEEKVQSIPLPPTTTRLPVPSVKSQPVSPALSSGSEEKKEMLEEKKMESGEPEEKKIKEEKDDEKSGEKSESDSTSYKYLREEDLDETPNGGLDILKSLENTVSSAISKAQTGTPTWGGYPSIHAAYQLQGAVKPSSLLSPSVQSVPMQPAFNSSMRAFVTDPGSVIHSPRSPSSPPSLRSNVLAMEELVEKVTGKASVKKEREERVVGGDRCRSLSSAKSPSPVQRDQKDGTVPMATTVTQSSSPRKAGTESELVCKKEPKDIPVETPNHAKNGSDTCRSPITNGSSLGIITDHSPERPFINPLSALQSIMNTHLSKASKPVNSTSDPLSMLYKISNSVVDKPLFNTTQVKQAEPVNRFFYENNDQPIDLSKSKSSSSNTSGEERSGNGTSCTPLVNSSINGNRPLLSGLSLCDSVSSPLRENALMDISDMVKNLTGRLTPKSSTPSSISEKSDVDGSTFEDTLEDLSPVQKRKGRQSNWNPQHLLILQAQFASSLRETPEGRYAMTDLGPQERVHICKFTGLSMTTISHWLANVKYQLRRTGGTKFLKNMDSCQPVFLCSDCASQFRTPSSYISHLESHLGFSLKDLSKLSADHLRDQQAVSKMISDKLPFGSPLASMTATDDDSGSGAIYQCRLCNRTFVSKHAIKLHLSKTHGKSPEDHLVFVTALEKLEKQEKV